MQNNLENFWYRVEDMGCKSCVKGWVYPTRDARDAYNCTRCVNKYRKQFNTRQLLVQTSITQESWEQATKANCKKYIEDWESIQKKLNLYEKNKESIFLCGVMNTGKTLLLNYIARKHLESGILADVYTVSTLLIQLRYKNPKFFESFEKLVNISVLLLDDFPLSTLDWNDSVLYSVVNERYLKRRRTFITGNSFPSEAMAKGSYDFERTASKIKRYYLKINF